MGKRPSDMSVKKEKDVRNQVAGLPRRKRGTQGEDRKTKKPTTPKRDSKKTGKKEKIKAPG